MRAKLYCKLSAMGLKSMLSELVRADISTIDSFVKNGEAILFELGIDPEFEVSDEEESKIMLGEAIKTVVENNAEYKEVSELMSGRSGYVFLIRLRKFATICAQKAIRTRLFVMTKTFRKNRKIL